MARGFESKDVEFQQAEADRRASAPRRSLTAEERAVAADRQALELTIACVRGQLAAAASDAHRRMLTQALEDLEHRLAAAPDVAG